MHITSMTSVPKWNALWLLSLTYVIRVAVPFGAGIRSNTVWGFSASACDLDPAYRIQDRETLGIPAS